MEHHQDYSSAPELNQSFFEVFCVSVMALAWGVFILSAKSYSETDWYHWLLYSRIVMSSIGFALAGLIISRNLYSLNLSSWYLLISVGVQASHGYLEGVLSVDFYNFTGIIFVLACLSFNGPINKWIKLHLPLYLIIFSLPLTQKAPVYFYSIGEFINSFSLMVSGVIIGIGILKIISSRYTYILKYLQSKELVVNMAYDVAHDIRSPVAALKIALKDVALEPIEKEIIDFSLLRIDEIANNLLSQHKHPHTFYNKYLCEDLENLIKEKRLSTKDSIQFSLKFDSELLTYQLGSHQPKLLRVLSNLLNNSIESIDSHQGLVNIDIVKSNSDITITVSDNGIGIPVSVLQQLQARSFSFNKKNGNGFGLKNAREFLKTLNGELIVESKLNLGTQVRVKLPVNVGSL